MIPFLTCGGLHDTATTLTGSTGDKAQPGVMDQGLRSDTPGHEHWYLLSGSTVLLSKLVAHAQDAKLLI